MSYGEQLVTMTNESLRNGTPPQEIILNLELLKIELANRVLAHAFDAPATNAQPEGKPLIILPPGREA